MHDTQHQGMAAEQVTFGGSETTVAVVEYTAVQTVDFRRGW
jgi:hypothetical protein